MNDRSWEILNSYAALYEAELAAGRLSSVGIPSRIDQHGGMGVLGPGHAGKSVRGVTLLVPTNRVAEARTALDLDAEGD